MAVNNTLGVKNISVQIESSNLLTLYPSVNSKLILEVCACLARGYLNPMTSDLLMALALYPGPPFNFARGGAKIRHLTSLWTSISISMEMPPFTMTSFKSAHGQVAVWCKYSSSKTGDRIAS